MISAGFKQAALVLALLSTSCLSPAQSDIRRPDVESFLKTAGRELARRSPEGLVKASDLYRQAAEVAPENAAAWAGLAESSALAGLYGARIPSQAMPEARKAAERALQLDPENALIHAVRGLVQYLHEWDWKNAEASFSKAIQIDPSLPEAHHWEAMMFSATGRHDEALTQIREAASLKPNSALFAVKVGTVLANAGRLDEARSTLEAVTSRFPNSVLGWNEWGLLELREDRNQQAIARFSKALEIDPGSERALAGLAVARSRLAEPETVRDISRQLNSPSPGKYISSTILAEVRLAEGSVSGALDELERAYEMRDPELVYLLTRPGLAPLWNESRFRKLVLEIGLRTKEWN